MPRPQVLLVGDSTRTEFCGIVDDLGKETSLYEAADPKGALSLVRILGEPPDLIVLLQPSPLLPGEIALVHQVCSFFPLTPLVVVLGAWAEGETRTARPINGALRIFWHDWSTFWGEFLACFKADRLAVTSLPRTSTPEEYVLFEKTSKSQVAISRQAQEPTSGDTLGGDYTPQPAPGSAVLITPIFENFRLLQDTLRSVGWRCAWLRQIGNASAMQEELCRAELVIVDILAEIPELRQTVKEIRLHNQNVPILVLQAFPRPQETATLQDLGPCQVMAKPVDLEHFLNFAVQALNRAAQTGNACRANSCGQKALHVDFGEGIVATFRTGKS
ncbi:MAG: response regulator [Thermoguttaceae bacterium]|nr:response regulator [Thermoguttaceae bacterium]MDW8078556.1 response regulator [Thermoguttaceae bacterium]